MVEERTPRGRPPGSSGDELLAIARAVFLDRGFARATMDEVASRAHISKASLYRAHRSKAALYAAVVSDWAAAGRGAMRPALNQLVQGEDPESDLIELGATIRAGVLSPTVLAMRHLVSSEAEAHPEVAATYFAESWERNIDDLADAFRDLDRQGKLEIDDPRAAADEFTWLVIGAALNAALLKGDVPDAPPRLASAVALFLARYAPDTN
ncbi:TetR/AcrR family transcriptional regulator [Glaciibacter superstes]|uniref:TetR/AcrR family transcriptional regulator n=1 Tax=Glaciibacter superstes TaxID=501023 RepID=UPI000527CA79|nr:TetR/AcrR family transcriptional regulator [Glaciibacter superstes]